jgi:hypothetical protein
MYLFYEQQSLRWTGKKSTNPFRNFMQISNSQAKDNIVLVVEKSQSSTAKDCDSKSPYNYIFEPMLCKSLEEIDHFPITILYCKNSQRLGYGYEMTGRVLGDKFVVRNNRGHENACVVMYHLSVEKESGEVFLESHVLSIGASIIYICPTRIYMKGQVIQTIRKC